MDRGRWEESKSLAPEEVSFIRAKIFRAKNSQLDRKSLHLRIDIQAQMK